MAHFLEVLLPREGTSTNSCQSLCFLLCPVPQLSFFGLCWPLLGTAAGSVPSPRPRLLPVLAFAWERLSHHCRAEQEERRKERESLENSMPCKDVWMGPQCDFPTHFHVVCAFWRYLTKRPRIMQNHSESAGSRIILRILWFIDSELFL